MKAKQVAVVRGKKKTNDHAKAAVEKFTTMHGIRVSLSSQTVNSLADRLEQGELDILFLETILEKSEINFLLGCISRSKRLPVIICSTDNYDAIKKEVPSEKIFNQKSEFSTRFVFNCIRNLLTPPNHKLDTRYIKSILMSVLGVIQQNTKITLKPEPISEIKQKEMPGDFVSAVTFYGDGFLGSFTIRTSRTLTTKFAQKIFFADEDTQFDDDTLIDLLGEISNQILGVARNELKEFGYELRNSLQLVCAGKEFLYNTTSNGRYYEIPFTYQDELFNITFCYNTYQTSVFELEIEEDRRDKAKFDLRLLKAADNAIKLIWKNNLQADLKRSSIFQHKAQAYHSSSMHIFHAAGWQGELSISIDLPYQSLINIYESMFGPQDQEVDRSQLNDVAQELLNQIGGHFLKQVKDIGYTFMRIYQGSFCQKDGLNYLLKIPGFSSRLWYEFNGFPLILCIGIRSDYCDSYFDTWPYLHQQSSFNEQRALPAS